MKTSQLLIIAWLACPAFYWMILRRWCSVVKLGCFAYLTGYVLLLVTVGVVGSELWHEMQSYDLNGDGHVMGTERTPPAIDAEIEWSSDTGRQLAPVVGLFYVLIWYTVVLLLFWAAESIVKSLQTKRKTVDKTIVG